MIDWGYFWLAINPHLPLTIWGGALIIMILISIISKCYFNKVKSSCLGIMMGYLFIVLCSTVFCRSVNEIREINLIPFYSYYVFLSGIDFLLFENILNVVLFVPMGILLPIITEWSPKKCFLCGSMCSGIIEVLQLILKRGLFEVDDLIHNTVGFIIGYCIYYWLYRIKKLVW